MDEIPDNKRQQLHAVLIKKRDELLAISESARGSESPVELDQSRMGRLSRMDAMQGQAMSMETKRRREDQLRKIATALARIESDDYGYCISCDELIAIGRLEVDPAAKYCIKCAD